MTKPSIVAHRGAPAPGVPENSMLAFERALALGADAIEFDVRLTRDGVPVIHHPFAVFSAPQPRGVFDMTLDQLADVELKDVDGHAVSECRIPTLSAVLDRFGGAIGL